MSFAATPILTSVLGGVASAVVGGLMSKPKAPAAAPPKAEPPPTMPTPDDAKIRTAKRRSAQTQSQRSGRMSTILSDDYASDNTLG